VIPELIAESLGGAAALVSLAVAGLLTIFLLFVQSLGEMFRDRNS